MECARLTVPADHAEPAGATLELDVARRPATDPESRIGTLVVNPGGPGGSGVQFVRGGVALGPEVEAAFDLVGWDPRGVGATAPRCGESLPDFYAADSEPSTGSGQIHLEELARQVAEECADAAGTDLAALSTSATVEDLELLRQALDEPLNYLGFSYGSQLGLLYAESHGEELRSMALVGVVDPALDFAGVLRGQAAAAEAAFARMLDSCVELASCTLEQPLADYDELAALVRDGQFESSGLGPAQLADAALGAVYGESRWPGFLGALQAALDGDAAPMLAETDNYYGTGDLFLPYTAISCLAETPPRDYREFAEELQGLSPRFGSAIANELLPCAFWEVAATDAPTEVHADAAPPILLAGSRGDAITPINWQEAVAERLAEPVVIIRDGDGHSAASASECVAAGIARYLLEPATADRPLECES